MNSAERPTFDGLSAKRFRVVSDLSDVQSANGLLQFPQVSQTAPNESIHRISTEGVRRISLAQKGVPETDEARKNRSLASGGVRLKVYPLAVRGAATEEIMKIQKLSRRQVGDSLAKLRLSGELSKPTREEEREAKRKAHLGKPRNASGKSYSYVEEREFNFAKALVDAELITNNLDDYKEVIRLFIEKGLAVPSSAAARVRNESFFKALVALQTDNYSFMEKYKDLGKVIDESFFANGFTEGERFIYESVTNKSVPDILHSPLDIRPDPVVYRKARGKEIRKSTIDNNTPKVEYIFEEYNDVLKRYAYKLLGNYEDALDVVQDTYIHLLMTADNLKMDETSNPRAYAMAVLYDVVADRKEYEHAQKRDYRKTIYLASFDEIENKGEVSFPVLNNEKLTQYNLATSVVEEVVSTSKNPGLNKKIFMMKFAEGFTISFIADELGISEDSVSRSIRKTMNFVKAKLRIDEHIVEESVPVSIKDENNSIGKSLKYYIEDHEERIEDSHYAEFWERNGNRVYSLIFFQTGMDHIIAQRLTSLIDQKLKDGEHGMVPVGMSKDECYVYVANIVAPVIAEHFLGTDKPGSWGYEYKKNKVTNLSDIPVQDVVFDSRISALRR